MTSPTRITRSAAAVALAAPVVSAWLFWREGAWDTYRTPLFWPFFFAAGLMASFSTSPMAADTRPWRSLVARAAFAAAAAAAAAAALAARNPITGLHARDIAALGILAAALVAAAGFATELGERVGPGTWMKTAWCVAACLLTMAAIPRLLLLVH